MSLSSDKERHSKLRQRAEEKLRENSGENIDTMDAEKMRSLLHELHVHQVELELQNEELRRTQLEAEEARLRLSRLYENAPIGYVVLDKSGFVMQANATFSKMLHTDIQPGKPFAQFIAPEYQPVFRARFRNLFQNPENKFLEVKIRRPDGAEFDAHLEAQPNVSIKTRNRETADFDELLVTVIDITERKRVQRALEESEERVQMVLKGADLGSWDWQVQTGKVVFDERWAQMLGFELSELDSNIDTWKKLIHPDDRTGVLETLENHLRGETPFYETEHRIRTKYGGWIWVLDRGRVTERDKNNKAVRMAGTHLNITDRKQNEKNNEIIRSTQELLLHAKNPDEVCSTIAEAVHQVIGAGIVGVSLIDESRNAVLPKAYTGLEINLSKVFKVLGMDATKRSYSLDDMTDEELELFQSGKLHKLPGGVHALLVRKVPHAIAVAVEKMLGVKEVDTIGFAYDERHHGGVSILAKEDIRQHAPVIEALVHTASITIHRMKSDAAKLASELRFREIFDGSRDGYAMVDIAGRITDCNKSFCEMLGYTLEELQALESFDDITPQKWHAWEHEEIWEGRLLERGYSGIYEKEYVHKSGSVFPVELQCYAVRDADGEFDYVWGVARDITDRKEAQQVIAAERERLMVTLKSIGDGVITTDTEGKVVIINGIAEELTGWSADTAAGKPLEEVFRIVDEFSREPCASPVDKVLTTGEIINLANHTLLISRDGTEHVIADSGAPIRDAGGDIVGVVVVFRDVTEKQRIAEQMQQSEKLEALGVLAGGIAHDFNNLLVGIFGYIEIAREYSGENDTVREYLDRAMGTFNRAKDLTQQLLTFSKGGSPVRKSGDIASTIKSNASFVLSGSSIGCVYDIPNTLWHCNYDENQIGQVLDNILINAQQAMPMGGTITIKAGNVRLEENQIGTLGAGRYVEISIADEGVGIPESVIGRIFDPFFSTKQKGSGLGLATCYSILQKHDGHITVTSRQGKGSMFSIYLPAAEIENEAAEDVQKREYQGNGAILIMDDEDFIRKIAGEILKRVGFEIIEAADGEQAIEQCRMLADDQDLLKAAILDLTIPGGLSGKEAVGEIRKILPSLPIFASSGYSDDPVMGRPEEFGFTASIAKPYGRKELLDTLFGALGSMQ